MTFSTVCTVEGCERRHVARGLCSMHYERWRATGTTDPPVRRRGMTHGKHSTYCAGCRCPECREAHTEHMRRWRSGATKIDPRPRSEMDALVGL